MAVQIETRKKHHLITTIQHVTRADGSNVGTLLTGLLYLLYVQESFDACYSLSRIEIADADRAPNLLMASYGFCTGGGEALPVELANMIKKLDYNVTYLDCAQEPRNNGVRENLRSDIPMVPAFRHLKL